jgi:transposase
VKAEKNDDRDAEAMAQAATRPTMRVVPAKSEEQSDVQALHRARSRLIAERTALIPLPPDAVARARDRGAEGRKKLEEQLGVFADAKGGALSPRMRLLVEDRRR